MKPLSARQRGADGRLYPRRHITAEDREAILADIRALMTKHELSPSTLGHMVSIAGAGGTW